MDKRLSEVSHRRAPVDEVMKLVEQYRRGHRGWNVKHFHAWYRRDGGGRSYTWVKNQLQGAGVVKRYAKRGAHRKRREAAANDYIRSRYLPAYHAEFKKPAREDGSAFVPCRDLTVLDDILCEHHERTVGSDNCVRYRRRALQIPADRHRCHYVKAKVKVLDYPDQGLAIHHDPRELARYDARGQLL